MGVDLCLPWYVRNGLYLSAAVRTDAPLGSVLKASHSVLKNCSTSFYQTVLYTRLTHSYTRMLRKGVAIACCIRVFSQSVVKTYCDHNSEKGRGSTTLPSSDFRCF